MEHSRGSHADDFNDTEPCYCHVIKQSNNPLSTTNFTLKGVNEYERGFQAGEMHCVKNSEKKEAFETTLVRLWYKFFSELGEMHPNYVDGDFNFQNFMEWLSNNEKNRGKSHSVDVNGNCNMGCC